MKTIGIIGGDGRAVSAASEFRQSGYEVKSYGLEKAGEPDNTDAFNSDITVLPIPFTTKTGINMPFSSKSINPSEIISRLNSKIIFGGGLNKIYENQLVQRGFKYYSLTERNDFNIYNAVPTAEGAVEIAIHETPFTLSGSNILITGGGRIAKELMRILNSFGAKCTCAVRKSEQAAEAEALHCKTDNINNIPVFISDFDIIFNTVPAPVIDSKALSAVKKDVLITDLASSPGGVDYEYAEKHGIKAIHALGLPGKTAPETAGRIIKKTIENILSEMEETDYA